MLDKSDKIEPDWKAQVRYEMDLKIIWDLYANMGLEPSEDLKRRYAELYDREANGLAH